jgi:hypothetical protein
MPGACGLACEVCGSQDEGFCPIGGCVPGTDPQAPDKAEKLKVALGEPCMILECAIQKGADHCFRCDEFPCDVHYKQEVFSHKLLDTIKGIRKK